MSSTHTNVIASPLPAAERLRIAGLRSTLPRRTVLDLLGDTRDHLSADAIVRELHMRGLDLGRSSVNKILRDLADHGLARRVDTIPGAARYETNLEPHDHFWCRSCRKAFDVTLASPGPVEVPGRIDETSTTHLGICSDCG